MLSTLVQSLRDLSRPALDDIVAIKNNPNAAARLARIMDDVEGHAAATAMPRTVCNLIVAVGLVLWITAIRQQADPTWIDGLVGIVIASLALWVFTSVLPASIAKHAGEITVYSWSMLLRFLYVVGSPLRSIARVVDEVVKRLAGKADQTEAEVLQEEILSVVEEGREEGQFDESERDMIEAVVKFRDKTVGQVMTPRTEIHALELSNNLGEVTAAIRRIGHSRIPVYTDSLDHVVGIFYVKDLMRWLAGESSRGGKTFDLKSLLRPAYYVPETKTVRELLAELLSKRVHIAMVADEYGGTAGLVTIEDIIEEVFGDIQDEYEGTQEETPEVKVMTAERMAEVDARAYIADANDQLRSLSVEIPESEDYDTVGGFVTVTLGRIPAAGEQFTHEGIKVTVLAAEPTRVTRVRLEALAATETAVEDAALHPAGK
ncbi:MAG: HlyC/CorC family transporter [Planctomycetes bacterium]|nr:HlyC/CorC family transporter [Planctomycetota bacterium]